MSQNNQNQNESKILLIKNFLEENENSNENFSLSNENNFNLNIFQNLSSNFNEEERNFHKNKITKIINALIILLNLEKKKLKEKNEKLNKIKNNFLIFKQKEINFLETLKNNFQSKINKKNILENEIIDLNISGIKEISTTRNTLRKYKNSVLSILFSGKIKLPSFKGKIFIDREPQPFINLINFLRTGKFPIFENFQEEKLFFDELNFWKISINNNNNFNLNLFNFDFCLCSNSIKIINNKKIEKNSKKNAIVIINNNFDFYNNFIEFKIKINKKNSNKKKQILIGLINKNNFNIENLNKNLNKNFNKNFSFSNSFYWDVFNKKLIKTNEFGKKIDDFFGYGCDCENNEFYLGIKFDYVKRNVSFYKNKICMGIAFNNVDNNLNPFVNLFFQDGFVEIVNENNNNDERIFL